MKLTAKQRKFVAEYVKCGNATQSAIKAGYSEKTARQAGTENLAKPETKGWGIISSVAEAKLLGEVYNDMRYHATIYTKPHCVKCRQTVIRLTLPKETRVMADYPDIREKFISMGIRSMPVVVITKGKDIEDIWCDYQIDKIKRWNKAHQNNN